MAGTIIPMVDGERHTRRRVIVPWAYAGASVAAAAVFGLLLAHAGGFALRPLLGPAVTGPALTGIAALALAAMDLGLARRVPHVRRQVPSGWRHRHPPRLAAVMYGAALGPGVGTRTPNGLLYLLVLWAALVGAPVHAAIVFAAYGAGRAAPVTVLAVLRRLPPQRLDHVRGTLTGRKLAAPFEALAGAALAWPALSGVLAAST